MSNTLTWRRFRDDCCTVVANPADKGVRGKEGVRVKMGENVSKEAQHRDGR